MYAFKQLPTSILKFISKIVTFLSYGAPKYGHFSWFMIDTNILSTSRSSKMYFPSVGPVPENPKRQTFKKRSFEASGERDWFVCTTTPSFSAKDEVFQLSSLRPSDTYASVIFGSDNVLVPTRPHAVILTSAAILLIWSLGTYCSEKS